MDDASDRNEKRIQQNLNKMAEFTEHLNQSLSLYFRITGKEVSSPRSWTTDDQLTDMSTCKYCGSPLRSGNYTIRLLPGLKPTQKISALMQRYKENPSSLGRYQRKLVEDFRSSTNKMKVTCFTCKKSWKLTGQPCIDRLKQRREFEASMKDRHNKKLIDEKRNVNLDEESRKLKQGERKERKKELKRQKRQKKMDKDWNAGLNIVKLRKDLTAEHTDWNNPSTSGCNYQHDSKSTKLVETERNNGADNLQIGKQSASIQMDSVEDNNDSKWIADIVEEKKRKQRFASHVRDLLKQEETTFKKKDGSSKKKKSALQAFLTKI